MDAKMTIAELIGVSEEELEGMSNEQALEAIEERLEPEKAAPRSIDKLYDLPYSEMTEEEVELIVEYKATIKARNEEYERQREMMDKALQEQIEIAKERSRNVQDTLDRLVAHAIGRYEEASNG